MKKTLITLSLLSSFALGKDIKEILKPGEDLLQYIPDSRQETWETLFRKPKSKNWESFDTQVKLEKKGDILFDESSKPHAKSKSQYNKQLIPILYEEEVLEKSFQDEKKYEKVKIYLSSDQKKLLTEKTYQGKTEKEDYSLDQNTIYVTGHFLSSLIQSKRFQTFEADVVSLQGNHAMKFEAFETKDPTTLSDKYEYPQKFKDNLAKWTKNEKVKVYQMGLYGVKSMFYKHKFYFIFSSENRFIAFFGGDPETGASFDWVKQDSSF